jgi:uncharacterized membrane protein
MPSEVTTVVAQPAYQGWVERGASTVELLAVALIIGFIVIATGFWIYQILIRRGVFSVQYEHYRASLGRSLLLGLEILVAADIVRTVALEPTLRNILILGLLVVIRTFLSWSIVLEIEGRWPWQARPGSNPGAEQV